ncbi:MAG: permease [Actinomycetota bacterium]
MTDTAILVVELLILFVSVSFLVEILQRRLGPEQLRRWIGGRPPVAALKGIAIGFVTPFCTYSAVPLLVGLRRAGVPAAGYIAFIAAAPVLDPILFGALWLITGPTVAITYALVTFAAAMTLALVAQRVGVERHLRPVDAPVVAGGGPAPHDDDLAPHDDEGCASSCDPAEPGPWRGWGPEARAAFRGSGNLLRAFGPLMAIGIAIGLAIEAFVSPDIAAEVTTGAPWLSIPVASALGTPLYFSTELFVPIAHSLEGAGVGVGAIVALTISGAGANLPEFVVLSRMARPAAVSIFFAFVFSVAIAGGALAHLVAA